MISPISADGPAVFIMFIVGFVVVGLAMWVEFHVHATYLVASGDVVLADDRARSGAGATAEGDHDRLAIPPPCRGRAPRGVNTSMSKKEAARTGQARERVRSGPSNRALIAAAIATVISLAILISLGNWQVQRLAWKEGLIRADAGARLW